MVGGVCSTCLRKSRATATTVCGQAWTGRDAFALRKTRNEHAVWIDAQGGMADQSAPDAEHPTNWKDGESHLRSLALLSLTRRHPPS